MNLTSPNSNDNDNNEEAPCQKCRKSHATDKSCLDKKHQDLSTTSQPSQPSQSLRQDAPLVASEEEEEPSLFRLKHFMIMQPLHEFKLITKLSKFDALLHIPTLDGMTSTTATTMTTNPSVPEYVKYLSFYDTTTNHNNTTMKLSQAQEGMIVVGNNRCQLICQMYLKSYLEAQQQQQQENYSIDENDNKNPKVSPTTDGQDNDAETLNNETSTSSSVTIPNKISPSPLTDNTPPEKDVPSSKGKVQSVIEQIYEIIFHQHRIDDDCQRSGTFVVLLSQEPKQEDENDDTTKMVELPKTWAFEFIRQQLDRKTTNDSNESHSSVVATTAAAPSMPKEQIDSTFASSIVNVPVTSHGVTTGTDTVPTPTITTETSNAFRVDDETIKRRRRSSLLRRSVSSGDVFADHKKRMATYRGSIVLSQQIHQNAFGDDDEDFSGDSEDMDGDREHSLSNDTLKSANDVKTHRKQESANSSSSQLDDGAEWLPSLSRFTSTQSFLSQSSLLSWNRTSKKVLSPFRSQRPILERTPSWSEGITDIQTNHDRNIIIHTANALDVILMKNANVPQAALTDGEAYQLIPTQHTGNSRIAVMVQLDMPKYLEYLKLEEIQNDLPIQSEINGTSVSTSNSKIRQLCRDLVNAVQTNYDGRFLMEQNDAIDAALCDDNNIDYYVLLSDEQAVSAVECIFQLEKKNMEQVESSVDKSHMDRNAVQLPPTGGGDDNNQSSTAGTKKSRTPSLIKKEAMEQLYRLSSTINEALMPSGGDESVDGNMSTTTASTKKSTANSSTTTMPMSNGTKSQDEDLNIHKSAVMLLQQRKKRQGLSNKISQMGTLNNPSAAAILEGRKDGRSQEQRQVLSSSLRFPTPLQSNEYMQRNHSTGHDDRFYSSLPAGLNYYEYESGDNINRLSEESTLRANQSRLSSFTLPPTSNERNELQTTEFSGNRMSLHPTIPVTQDRDNDLSRQNLMYQPQFQLQQNMEDHHYYQIQQEQLYQQQQLYNAQQHQNRRQSALSKFSQDMIQEMLVRAHGTTTTSSGNSHNNSSHQVNNNNYDPSSDSDFLRNSFGSLDEVTFDDNPALYEPVPQQQNHHHQHHHQQQQQQQQNQVMNNHQVSRPAAPDIPVNADAAAAAYLLGFGRYEV